MHRMQILDTTGDETVEWNPEDTESVTAAQSRFDDLKAKGYRFYEAVKAKGKEITAFDPSLGSIIAAPAATGGPVATRPV